MCERAHVKSFSVRVNDKNERVILRFIDGRLYTEESFEHELCIGSKVVVHRVAKNSAVIFCSACGLRVHIPLPEEIDPKNLAKQEKNLLAWFRDQFNDEPEPKPCHLCEKSDNHDCSMCDPFPPKIKTSEK